jgi:hypothetical protein
LEYWLTAKIYNVDDNIEVKVIVIFKGKLKSARGLLVYLVLIVVLYKMLNCLNLNFIAYPLKNPK